MEGCDEIGVDQKIDNVVTCRHTMDDSTASIKCNEIAGKRLCDIAKETRREKLYAVGVTRNPEQSLIKSSR